MKIEVFKGVYPPSEDTYLLASFLERISLRGKDVLDMGTGSGYLAVLAALRGANVTAADIDEKAVRNAAFNAKLNGVDIRVVRSDLFENINDKFDVILFNPPYLDTRDGVLWWDRGNIIERFMGEVFYHLKEGGRVLLVTERNMDIPAPTRYIRDYTWNLRVWELRACP